MSLAVSVGMPGTCPVPLIINPLTAPPCPPPPSPLLTQTVTGNRGQNLVDCTNCGAGLTFDEYKRIVVVTQTPEDKAKKMKPKAAAKAKPPKAPMEE